MPERRPRSRRRCIYYLACAEVATCGRPRGRNITNRVQFNLYTNTGTGSQCPDNEASAQEKDEGVPEDGLHFLPVLVRPARPRHARADTRLIESGLEEAMFPRLLGAPVTQFSRSLVTARVASGDHCSCGTVIGLKLTAAPPVRGTPPIPAGRGACRVLTLRKVAREGDAGSVPT